MTSSARHGDGRQTWLRLAAAAFFGLFAAFASIGAAQAETRTLKLYYVHTGERAEIAFKRDGVYLKEGLNQLNRFLRDWRRNEPTRMDPRLFDLVWSAYRSTGARDYIHVVSAYRSPATNAMLRRTRGGQAEKSQHMLGKAMDFYIPGVSLKKIREAGMKMQGGGVGYYPRSGSPFVHLDVAGVRAWPRMSRQELSRLFPDGKTLHLPADGNPLPGYQAALAAAKNKPRNAEIVVASGGGALGSAAKKSRGLLSSLFGGGADEEEEAGGQLERLAAAKPAKKAAPAEPLPGVEVEGEQLVAALPAREPAEALAAPRPQADVGVEQTAKAADVPLPTRRPAYKPETVEVAALEGAQPDGVAGLIEEGSADPDAAEALADLQGALEVPLPTRRPSLGEAEGEEIEVAALPSPRPLAEEGASAKGGRLISATQRQAVLASAGDPVAAALPETKTTAKSAKPIAADSKPAAQPRVKPVRGEDSTVALLKNGIALVPNAAKAPNFASVAMRKPQAVYTTGFTTEVASADTSRFTGKAVQFLSIAKFE